MKNTVLFLLVLPALAPAQAPVIEWQQCLGGSFGEAPNSIVATADGGAIFVGSTGSNNGDVVGHHGGADAWIVKLNASGNIDWQKCIGGSENDWADDIIQVGDGGFLMVGVSNSTDGDLTDVIGNPGYWLVKIDSSGSIQWQKQYGGSGYDFPSSVISISNGGFIVTGFSTSVDGDVSGNNGGNDGWIIVVDSVGNLQWEMNYGGSLNDHFGDVLEVDDGFLLVGYTRSFGSGMSDYWVVKIDQFGTMQWQNFYGGPAQDDGYKVARLLDGSFVLAGLSTSYNGDVTFNYGMSDFWIVRFDTAGSLLSEHSFGGSHIDWLRDMKETSDGGLLISGDTRSIDGDITNNQGAEDAWLMKLDMAGNVEWQRTYGGTGAERDYYLDITESGDYFIAGGTTSNDGDVSGLHGDEDVWVVRLTHNYNLIQGSVFADMNNDLIHSPNEPVLEHHMVSESLSQRITFSLPSTGEYELSVLSPGSFPTSPAPLTHYVAVPLEQTINFAGLWEEQTGVDFAFQPLGVIDDLQIELTPMTAFRSGFPAQYELTWRNVGTTSLTPLLTVEHDPILQFDQASVTPTNINGDSLVWSMPEIGPFESGSLNIHFTVDQQAIIGYEVVTSAWVEPIATDEIPSNNLVVRHDTVTLGWDPNDILVDRDSILDTDLPTTDPLDYLIRFQNTGNDTAFNVLINNPLPTNVDRSSFSFVDASHEVVLDYDNEEGMMQFRFYGIQLPDSNVNEAASHGFVRYRIQPLTTLLPGDSILNQASIFFDFNAPVITNTAYTVIENTTGISDHSTATFQMFPNPTTGQLNIRLASHATGSITIHDALGRQLVQSPINGNHHQLDLSDQPKGFYLVTLQTDQGISTQRLVLE